MNTMCMRVGEQTRWGVIESADDDKEKLIREVDFCGYREFGSAIEACRSKLSSAPSKSEVSLLEKLKTSWHGEMTTVWSKTLLFGDVAKRLNKTEKASLIKLVRRDLVKVWLVRVGGQDQDGKAVGGVRHLWDLRG